MQYGYFDLANKEYVITRPDTPSAWANYLGSPEYGAIISNNAGGYSFVKPVQTAELHAIVLIPIWHCRDGIFICGTMMQPITGRLPGSRSANRWTLIRAPVGTALPILLSPHNTAGFVPM